MTAPDHSDGAVELNPTRAPIATAPCPDQPVPAEYDLLCEECGYSLVGLMTDRCPECGRVFDPNELPLARIPWLYRRRLGHVRAYVRTVGMILFRPGTFARELCRPVRISAADAAAFRKVSVRIVPITGFLLSLIVSVAAWVVNGWPVQPVFVMENLAIIALVSLPVWPLVALGTDMPTFIWRGRPEAPQTLAPIHHYAAAPLALTPVLVPLATLTFIVAALVLPRSAPRPDSLILCAGPILLPIIGLLWWIPLRLMRAAGGCVPHVLLLGLYLPAHWILMTLGSAVVTQTIALVLGRVLALL